MTSLIYDANYGVSLPDGKDATHNIALSPLFNTHDGRGSRGSTEGAIMWRGVNGYLGSNSAQALDYWSNALVFANTVQPSNYWDRFISHSLRCLVSTTNS